ncbi:MAG TPA: trypsin-like peptidase domain-containing protein [Actinomycetes bacterium]|nr:trypsin-like peptidase domain-containing protein [Actinomycetes bacterium]
MALPLLATAGPATAAPKSSRTQGAAAPSNDLLVLLGDLLARILPTPAPAAPPAAAGVAASTVRVNGTACGVQLYGSGFSAAPDTVVTNAHVVAGMTTPPQVLRPDGRTFPAQVQLFDPDRDLAVLAVPGLSQPGLPLAPAVVGENAAVYGHPLGQRALEVSPARVMRRVNVDIGDIYEEPSGPRQLLVLNSVLDPGDSGAPVVNSAGQVIGVAFAVANLRRATAFAVASEELASVLAQPRSGPVSTGPCIV